MTIIIPDPHPGRCLNTRTGQRCEDRDHHSGSCRFPKPKPFIEAGGQSQSWGGHVPPEPWVPPWERETS